MKRIVSLLVIVICIITVSNMKKVNKDDIEENNTSFVEVAKVASIKKTKATYSTKTVAKEKPKYTKEELDLMSRLINAEAGYSFLSDEHQQLVGMVALNRVKHPSFPNTLREVIYHKGQYACTWDGNFEKQPTERAIENAKKVLSGEVSCPENVIWQSQQKQGDGVYKKLHNTYFCYSN